MRRNRDLYRSLTSDEAFRVDNDSELRNKDYASLGEHGQHFSKILQLYAEHLRETLSFKRFMKKSFFWLSFGIMIACILGIVVFGVIVAINANSETFDIQSYVIPFLTALTSFLTVFIVIPKIIAKYLFNSNEDDVMKSVVSSIQDYDKFVRKELRKKDDSSES